MVSAGLMYLKLKINKMVRVKKIAIILVVFILFAGCHRNPLKVDLSGVEVNLKVERLDQDLFKVKPENHEELLYWLNSIYGDFFRAYNEDVIALGDPHDPLYPDYLQTFLSDSTIRAAKGASDSLFTDLSSLEAKLQKAFRYYKYHFPEKEVPRVFTYISGFNQAMIMMPGGLGISLDNYLGQDCRLYTMLAFPEYKRKNMNPDKIPFDALFAWGLSEFEMSSDQDNLLANMIYQGKLMYFLDAVFPDERDELKIGYTTDKIEWCRDHEEAMWTYLIENKVLYTNDRMTILRFINPAPFTSAFSSESPGRTGVWLGWQIVRKYMKNHPEVTLAGLMTEKDPQKILNQSRYAP